MEQQQKHRLLGITIIAILTIIERIAFLASGIAAVTVAPFLFHPVLNAKQKKLFDATESNNLSQQNAICIADSTIFPSRNYLISKIQGVLKYLSEIHKITKLENHEGKEITVEELVDQYYKNPGKYFEDKSTASSPPSSSGGGTATTAIVISRTFIELAKLPEIKNNKKEGVSDEYYLHAKNGGESQQILCS